MLPRLETMLDWWQNNTPRSLQVELGPSELGDPCARRIAYKLTRKRQEPGLKWGALLGLFGHAGVEEVVKAWNAKEGRERYLVEHRVTADEESGLSGNTDLYDTDTDEVVDWKFVGDYSLKKYRAQGHPGQQYRVQTHAYGRGWAAKGHPVRSVRVVFLARQGKSIRDSWEWAEPYDEEIVLKALGRLQRIEELANRAHHGEIDYAAIEARPGDECRFCPYLRPHIATDGDGCAGTTSPPVDYRREVSAAKTVEHVQALWREARDAGRLDDELRALMTARAEVLKSTKQAELVDLLG